MKASIYLLRVLSVRTWTALLKKQQSEGQTVPTLYRMQRCSLHKAFFISPNIPYKDYCFAVLCNNNQAAVRGIKYTLMSIKFGIILTILNEAILLDLEYLNTF